MAQEIDFLEKRIKEDRDRVQELKFKEENEKLADLIRVAYQSYRDAGFSEDQSFWVVAQIIKRAFKNC